MRTFLLVATMALTLVALAGCTVNTYPNGEREVQTGVPQSGPTSNPADASRGQNGSGAMP